MVHPLPIQYHSQSPFSIGLLLGIENVFSWVQEGKHRGFSEWLAN